MPRSLTPAFKQMTPLLQPALQPEKESKRFAAQKLSFLVSSRWG
jgi:hypothetical protein